MSYGKVYCHSSLIGMQAGKVEFFGPGINLGSKGITIEVDDEEAEKVTAMLKSAYACGAAEEAEKHTPPPQGTPQKGMTIENLQRIVLRLANQMHVRYYLWLNYPQTRRGNLP